MSFFRAFCVLLVLSLSVSIVHAFEATGAATIDTSELGSFDTNKKKIKAKAIEAACLNALDKYTETFSISQARNYKKIREEVESDLSAFVRCGDPIDEEFNFATSEFSVVIKAIIKETAFEVAIGDMSAVNSDEESSDVLVIVFTRQVGKVKQKDAKVVKIDQTKTSVDVDQTEASTDTDTSISSTSTETNVSTTGGSTTQESERITYKVGNEHIDTITSAIEDPLAEAGYSLVSMGDFVDDDLVEAMMEDLAAKGKYSGKSTKGIGKAMKADEDEPIPHYIEGVFDIGRQEIDPATGMKSITVALKKLTFRTFINKKKSDLEDVSTWRKRPKTVASVSGVQQKGKGSNYSEATNNAISNAVRTSSLALLEKVRAKGVK